jgi:carboxypeptidase C (cathepsin A)
VCLCARAGCSSIFALLTENGPFRVEDDAFTLRQHLQSWNTVHDPPFFLAPTLAGLF